MNIKKSATSSAVAFSPGGYLGQLLGLVALLSWAGRWTQVHPRDALVWQGPWLKLGWLPSQRFALGFPTQRRLGRTPFLAVQDDELTWVKRICWARAFVDTQESCLRLTTTKVLGDGDSLEDLPAMGVSVRFDDPRKLDQLLSKRHLESRHLWFDEEGHHVASGKPAARWALAPWEGEALAFPDQASAQTRSLRDVMQAKLAAGVRDYMPYAGGAIAVPSEYRDLVAPFDPASVPQVR